VKALVAAYVLMNLHFAPQLPMMFGTNVSFLPSSTVQPREHVWVCTTTGRGGGAAPAAFRQLQFARA
jgi:hypothetical protein